PQEQLEFALGFYEAKQYKEAVRELQKLIKHYPKARQAPEAQYYIGKIAFDQSNLYEAFKEYQVVIDKYPFSDRSTEIIRLQYEIGEAILEGLDQRNKFIDAVSGANYDLIKIFRQVIKNAPYGKYAAPSQYKIGLYLMEKGLYPEARDEFEKVINDYPDSEWIKAAKYQIAIADSKRSTTAQYDQRITQSAVKEFKEFVEVYPDAELSKSAKDQILDLREKEAENKFLVGRYYEKRKQYSAAKIYYQQVVDEYGNTSWGRKALVKIQELANKAN
ncbi:MAG: outer membrane protein assembly factor BamD, partial [Candidatus Omnitrophica bacterium]|nr:outer membrane protein assembly factor BamD [Candidatus Omnitrophota bacterium]